MELSARAAVNAYYMRVPASYAFLARAFSVTEELVQECTKMKTSTIATGVVYPRFTAGWVISGRLVHARWCFCGGGVGGVGVVGVVELGDDSLAPGYALMTRMVAGLHVIA